MRLLGPRGPRNLLLVSLDTVRADRLGSYHYAAAQTPRLDALAASGLRFEQATTVVPLTLPAHSSLMTGTFPGWHGVRDNGGFYLGDDQLTLAEILRDKGFRTGGFVGAFVLDRRWGIAQGFDRYFDDFDLDRFAERRRHGHDSAAGSPRSSIARSSGCRRSRSSPFFAWVHLYDAHTPYEAPEPFRSRFPRTRDGAYDAEIASADAQVGRLLDALRADGRLDDTLVVVVADHGEMLGEHGEQTHGFFIYEAATRIPLDRQRSGRAGRGRLRPGAHRRRHADRAVAARGAGAEGGAGREPDAARARPAPRTRGAYRKLVSALSLRLERAALDSGRALQVDPGAAAGALRPGDRSARGARPIGGARRSRLDVFGRALDEFESRTARAGAPQGPRPIDAETEERLAALGYVAGSVSLKTTRRAGRAATPRTRSRSTTCMKQAGRALDRGEASTRRSRRSSRRSPQDPEIVEGYMLLGNFYKKLKRPQDAIAAYRDALARDSEHQNALFSLALAYKDEGRLDEARVGFERARELDPRNGKVLWQLADLWMRKGDSARAEAIITDALERKVDEPRLLLKLGESRIEAKRFDEAERALKAALEKKPGLALAHFDLGLVYEGKGQIDKAIALLRSGALGEPQGLSRGVQRREAAAEERPQPGRRSRISARSSRSNRHSAPASSISPRRCWTPAISAAPSNGRAPV